MKVFVSGSINISKLPNAAIQKIDNIISKNFSILIGDAKGVDSQIQRYLHKKNYKNVTVYFAGKEIRNNFGAWVTKNILNENNEKGRELYTLKDIAMVKDADYGLMIWDGKSQGTLNNIKMMMAEKKRFFVVLEGMIVDESSIDSVINAAKKKNTTEEQSELF